jgi:hypothetical protein
MVRSRDRTSPLMWLAVALLGGLVLAATVIGMAHAVSAGPVEPTASPGGIEGVLYEPDGLTPVGGGWIDIHDDHDEPWMGTETATDGSYQIANLPPGGYTLHAYPPPGSPYAASLPARVIVHAGQWSAQNLLLTEVQISGWVQDSANSARIGGAVVVAHDEPPTVERWSPTDANGEWKIGGVTDGVTYHLEVVPPPETEYVPLPVEYTAVPPETGVALELHIPPPNLAGRVHDYLGDPVPGAGVVVHHDDFWVETAAGDAGEFLFRGLPPGDFWVVAVPPWGVQGLLSSEPFTVEIAQPDTFHDVGVLTLPQAFKRATGRVTYAGTANAVRNAVVAAHRLDRPGYADTPTDETGAYTLSLAGGEWHLRVEPHPPPAPPAQWIFSREPAWIVFTGAPTDPERVVADLEVIPTNARVMGRVVCPGGVPCPADSPHWQDVRVELRNERIGNAAGLGPDYRFDIPIPDGWYELVVHVRHPLVQGPAPMPVFVGPGGQLDVGNVELLPKDAQFVGQVFNEQNVGMPGVPVYGWQPEGPGRGWAETDAQGVYTMPVISGEWFLEPQPLPEMPYVYRGLLRLARVARGGTVVGVDFRLTWAEARIRGIAVDAGDPASERLWGLDGWATAHRLPSEELFSEAPIWDGGFGLKVRGGHDYAVALHTPVQAPYVSGHSGAIAVGLGETVTTLVPLEHKDAGIVGQLIVAGSSPPQPAHGVRAEVFGEDERGHWTVGRVDPQAAEYGMEVVSGTWRLRAYVDPESGYVADPHPMVVATESGQPPAVQHLEVWPINATIRGRALQPDGSEMPEAFVHVEGESPHVGYFERHVRTDRWGYFELVVPEGKYTVGAGLPPTELEKRGWLNPPPIENVVATPDATVLGLRLRFRALDGEIEGTIRFAPSLSVVPTHPAYVWGWSENGEWAETQALTRTADTFAYRLRVISDTVWHIGAVYEDPDNGAFYESAEETVDLTASAQATQDLQLAGPHALPQPFIVSFDASQMQTIVMPDGVELNIPPGSLGTGTATLFIYPTREMRPEEGREVIGAGYEIWAVDQNGQEITHFNQDVIMTLPYPDDTWLESHGIRENLLIPVYYSTLAGRWILAESYVVDTANNEITLQIAHFTTFGTLATEEEQYPIYLPIVFNMYP